MYLCTRRPVSSDVRDLRLIIIGNNRLRESSRVFGRVLLSVERVYKLGNIRIAD
jgi:hypothetical protein